MKFFYQCLLLAIILFFLAARIGYSANFYLILYFMLLLASALAVALKFKNRKQNPVPNIYLKKEIIVESFLLLFLAILSYFFSWLWALTFLFLIEYSLSLYQYHQQK